MSEQAKPKSAPDEEVVPDCPHCGKPLPLCICDSVTPIDSNISLLILQHPQELGLDADGDRKSVV